MASTSEPPHLSGHHRNTLRRIFQHPTGHNIEWRAVVSLLEAIGSVETHRDNKVEVTVGSQHAFFDVPSHKDASVEAVASLRRLLAAAGYGNETARLDGTHGEN